MAPKSRPAAIGRESGQTENAHWRPFGADGSLAYLCSPAASATPKKRSVRTPPSCDVQARRVRPSCPKANRQLSNGKADSPDDRVIGVGLVRNRFVGDLCSARHTLEVEADAC